MRPQEVLAEAITVSRVNLVRYLVGFDDSTHTRMPPGLPNHVAWNLGHLALTMHRVAERIDGKPLPTTDFSPGVSGEGSATHAFTTESVAYGSRPIDDITQYPTYARCIEIFHAACERLATAVSAADDATLHKSTPWGGSDLPIYSLVLRMCFHNGTHCGQIVDIRRALHFKSIFA